MKRFLAIPLFVLALAGCQDTSLASKVIAGVKFGCDFRPTDEAIAKIIATLAGQPAGDVAAIAAALICKAVAEAPAAAAAASAGDRKVGVVNGVDLVGRKI